MKSATILDVLRAVTRVARGHEEVDAWWYAPPQRLRIAGELPRAGEESAPEVAIDAARGAEVDEQLLARELREALGVPTVRVRRYRGPPSPGRCFDS